MLSPSNHQSSDHLEGNTGLVLPLDTQQKKNAKEPCTAMTHIGFSIGQQVTFFSLYPLSTAPPPQHTLHLPTNHHMPHLSRIILHAKSRDVFLGAEW